MTMRVDQTNLASLGEPKVSWGKSTGLLQVPTLVWPLGSGGVHITIFPDDTWKFAEMSRLNDLEERRRKVLHSDDEEAEKLIKQWEDQGKDFDEIVKLLDQSAKSIVFDSSLEYTAPAISSVTFTEWHLTDPSSGSVWFNEDGSVKQSDSDVTRQWAVQNSGYFASLGLKVAT
jgi:hypothetical protein